MGDLLSIGGATALVCVLVFGLGALALRAWSGPGRSCSPSSSPR